VGGDFKGEASHEERRKASKSVPYSILIDKKVPIRSAGEEKANGQKQNNSLEWSKTNPYNLINPAKSGRKKRMKEKRNEIGRKREAGKGLGVSIEKGGETPTF